MFNSVRPFCNGPTSDEMEFHSGRRPIESIDAPIESSVCRLFYYFPASDRENGVETHRSTDNPTLTACQSSNDNDQIAIVSQIIFDKPLIVRLAH